MFAQKDRELLCIFCKDESVESDRGFACDVAWSPVMMEMPAV